MIRIACLIYDGFLLLDATGPLTAFEIASIHRPGAYSIELVAEQAGVVRCSGGVTLNAMAFRDSAGCDLLLIPGGSGAQNASNVQGLLDLIRDAALQGRRIASVCSGAFLLAESGVLHGRRATTHWAQAAELARLHPTITVDADSIFVRNGDIRTSAGITAGIDLALAIIEADYGVEIARRTARSLVVPFRRPGAQSQHSAMLDLVRPNDRFGELLAWARVHLAEPLTVERLADRAALSVRQFNRAFTESTGVSPARAIERLRLEGPRAALEEGASSIEAITRDHGFGNPDRMRRACIRVFGKTPQAMRSRVIPAGSRKKDGRDMPAPVPRLKP
ncbi:GlxA family transcriptional regulator [Novosphingobium sp. BL-52-GroH]|uniref:GlxA family transcriptional regulator n=1 Tax=Novosphingobium sp. BL-52-GroH TaxID=3349877 RepID=UPI00384AC029